MRYLRMFASDDFLMQTRCKPSIFCGKHTKHRTQYTSYYRSESFCQDHCLQTVICCQGYVQFDIWCYYGYLYSCYLFGSLFKIAQRGMINLVVWCCYRSSTHAGYIHRVSCFHRTQHERYGTLWIVMKKTTYSGLHANIEWFMNHWRNIYYCTARPKYFISLDIPLIYMSYVHT